MDDNTDLNGGANVEVKREPARHVAQIVQKAVTRTIPLQVKTRHKKSALKIRVGFKR